MNSYVLSKNALSRRQFFGGALGCALTFGLWAGMPSVRAAETATLTANCYKVAVCDWMILKRQKLSAFALTKEIGADGLELDMGGLSQRETFDSKLADPVEREKFLTAARESGVEISSLAMSGFYAQSFAERPSVERPVKDTIDTAQLLGVKVIFLPLGVQSDLAQKPELRPVVVERLKKAAMLAEKAGVVIGIETALDATGEAKLLDEIGSTHVKSYFNFSNALQNGRDLHHELQILGKDRICQIHCTDTDGVWLENNTRLDMRAVKATLDGMGWRGWLVIERSRDAKDVTNVKRNFTANAAYMKKIFGETCDTPANH